MLMAKRKTKNLTNESDGSYILKLVLYLIVGSQWVWILNNDGNVTVPIPVGLIIGLFFISHEKFQIDRKIEYAVLLVAVLLGFWAQVGVFIN